MTQFLSWLESTALSELIKTTFWVIPVIQTIHILALSTVLASILMINLRLLNLAWRAMPMKVLSERFLPAVWIGVPVLLFTGIPLIIAEPRRTLENPMFYLKMTTLVCVLVMTLLMRRGLQHNAGWWDKLPTRPGARAFAIASMLMWIVIAVAGRLIAYTG